jgi:plasmid stabilization system protein ParE
VPPFHPEAEQEMFAALDYYGEIDSLLAQDLQARLADALARIEEHPHQFPPYLLGTRRCLLRRFPYTIVFDVTPASVLVLAIAHQHQRPGYWSHRKP